MISDYEVKRKLAFYDLIMLNYELYSVEEVMNIVKQEFEIYKILN